MDKPTEAECAYGIRKLQEFIDIFGNGSNLEDFSDEERYITNAKRVLSFTVVGYDEGRYSRSDEFYRLVVAGIDALEKSL